VAARASTGKGRAQLGPIIFSSDGFDKDLRELGGGNEIASDSFMEDTDLVSGD